MHGSPEASQDQSTYAVVAEVLPIIRELTAEMDPETLLADIARQLKRLIDYAFLGIFLTDSDGSLKSAFSEGYESDVVDRKLRLGEGIVGAAAAQRQTVFVPKVAEDPRYVALTPDVVSELAIPMVHRDRLIGVVNIEGPDPAPFTSEVRCALQLLGDHLAVVIANASDHRRMLRYTELVEMLHEIGREAVSILELDQLLQRVAESVKRVIDYEMFGILLLDPERQELVLRQAVRFGEFPKKPRIKVSEGLCGAAVRSKEPVLVADVESDPRYVRLVPQTRSELVVPLIHRDRVVGVFDLASSQLDRFTEEHIRVLTPLAAQVAVAIENASLVEELRAREARREKEMAIAQRVQRGLFPEEMPGGEGWEAFADFKPAREVGGDLYDFYALGDQRVGLAVGDVSGKGVPAALYGAFASGVVRARAFQRYLPAELLHKANRTLHRRGVEGFYCTLAYALFDFESRELRIANSGLPYPLHYDAGSQRCRRLEIAGLPLGVFEEARYEERTVSLNAGDVFVFFSDGLVEAQCGPEVEDTARLEREIELHAHHPANQIGEAILAEAPACAGGMVPPDDMTLVVVKIL